MFLNYFTYEPMDKQHIQLACVDIIMKKVEAETLTEEE
jgi:hypothetical protein